MNADLEAQALAVLRGDEGVKAHCYDDATGKRVRAPKGNLTIGIGIDLEGGLDAAEMDWLERHRLQREWRALMGALLKQEIYLALLPAPAQLALAVMAFQLGAEKVMRFRKMIAAIARGRWLKAGDEAMDSAWARQTRPRAKRVQALLARCAQ